MCVAVVFCDCLSVYCFHVLFDGLVGGVFRSGVNVVCVVVVVLEEFLLLVSGVGGLCGEVV